jgi:serine phosphatase RsbU (regulator of sigma subunit)
MRLLPRGATSRGRRLLVAVALGLWLLDLLLGLVGRKLPSVVGVPARTVLGIAGAWLVWRGLRWLSERLLWRIRTKLILSYLFIALVPVLLMTAFSTIAGVLLLGLVGSRMVTGEIDRAGDVIRATARSALVGLPATDAEAVQALPARLAALRELHPDLAYALVRGGRVVAARGPAPREIPEWLRHGPGFSGLVATDPDKRASSEVLRAAWVEGAAALVVQVPADPVFYAGVERRTGIHVIPSQVIEAGREPARGEALHLENGSVIELGEGGTRVQAKAEGGFAWFALPEKTSWATGEKSFVPWLPVAFRYQPMDIVRRLSPASLRELGMHTMPEFLLYLLGILGAAFVALYGFALGVGLLLARQITRGVHDLSLGTERLRQGDFSHLIRIRSHDQLGDLAESFNLMSRSLQALIQEQGERQRLEEELRIARQIQMSLLPGDGLVSLPGIRVAALCLPAAEVGGDYYDLLPLGESRMGVLVADVSGKGTSAALYMAELKGLVLSLSRIHSSPARLLCEANRILSANMDSRSFVTMTYAVVDTGARRMRYARAGHNPLIHFQARTLTTQVLAPAGLGLGLDPGERFEQILEEAEVALEPGDVFLLFTDGLSEAMNERAELFGEARLRRILEQGPTLGSEQMKERILTEVRRFVGDAAPHDDLTLVLLKVVPEEVVPEEVVR